MSWLLAEEITCVLALVFSGGDRLCLGPRLSALGSMRRAYLNRMLFVRHIRFSYSFGVLRAELLALGTWHSGLGMVRFSPEMCENVQNTRECHSVARSRKSLIFKACHCIMTTLTI